MAASHTTSRKKKRDCLKIASAAQHSKAISRKGAKEQAQRTQRRTLRTLMSFFAFFALAPLRLCVKLLLNAARLMLFG